MTTTDPAIPGLRYVPDYVDEQRERDLIHVIDQQSWLTDLKRRVQHYGYRYDYKARKVSREMYLGPLPGWLQELCAELCQLQLMPRPADQVIINEYEPGQGISAHVDCVPCFDDVIVSLSLGSACAMEFTRAGGPERVSLFLGRRSLIVMSGEARYDWRHAIPGRKSDRHGGLDLPRSRRLSLTFRNVLLEKAAGS